MRTLILYVFHVENDNLRLFLERGLVDEKEFIFIYNQTGPLSEIWDTVLTRKNVHLLIRPNLGQDFQGWNTALFLPSSVLETKIIAQTSLGDVKEEICAAQTSLGDAKEEICAETCTVPYLYTQFDRFVFINSTVAGPYLPLYATMDWVDCFTSPLSEEVKIVGISANFMATTSNPRIQGLIQHHYGLSMTDASHIQSMIFGLDRSGLTMLIEAGLFAPRKVFPTNKHDVVITCEIGMSMLFRAAGYSMFAHLISQGLIPASRRDATDNYWNHPQPFPLCELMFVKTMPYIVFPEQSRYDRKCHL